MTVWSLKVNDPTMSAWLCVLMYTIAAVGSFLKVQQTPSGQTRTFWTGMSMLCGLLAINKQLDVHSALLGVAREPAAGDLVAWIAVVIFISAGGVAVFLMLPALRRPSRSMLMAISALSGLAVILVGRNTIPALSRVLGFHLTSETETLLHLHVSELFELLLAGVIWLVARHRAASIKGPQFSPR